MQTQNVIAPNSAFHHNSSSHDAAPPRVEKSREPHLLIKRDWYTTTATFIAGGVAGACSRTLTAPLDRIKIIVQEGHLVHTAHQQISSFKSARLRDVVEIIRHDGGWRAFWRGNGVNCLKAGPEFAMVFTFRRYLSSLYEDVIEAEQRLKEELEKKKKQQQEEDDNDEREIERKREKYEGNGNKIGERWREAEVREIFMSSDNAVASSSLLPAPFNCYWTLNDVPRIFINFYIGATAGFGAQFFLYPLEVVKTRIIVSKMTEFQGGMREVISEAYRAGGIKEFYRGITPNMVGVFIYRGLEVGLYSTMQQRIMMYRINKYNMSRHDASLSSFETAIVGMISSMIAQTVSYPLNVVRTRLQTQGVNGRAIKYNGMIDCFVKMVRTKGVASLFSGITANYLKAVPASASMFVVFEKVQSILVGDD